MENIDVWQVQLESGEVGKMNLDTLDAAFQAGVIDESTFVLAPGSTTWVRLGEALADEAPSDAVRMEIPPYPSYASVPAVAVSTPSAPASYGAPAASPWAATYAPADQAPAYAAYGYGEAPSVSPPPVSVGPDTLRPTANELPVDETDFAPRARSYRWVGWSLVGAAALAILGIGGYNARQAMNAKKALDQALAAAAPLPAEIAKVEPASQPVATGDKAATPSFSSDSLPKADDMGRLSDDQKKALLGADQARLAKQKAKAAATSKRGSSRSKSVFHKGGDPHDPLNASL